MDTDQALRIFLTYKFYYMHSSKITFFITYQTTTLQRSCTLSMYLPIIMKYIQYAALKKKVKLMESKKNSVSAIFKT